MGRQDKDVRPAVPLARVRDVSHKSHRPTDAELRSQPLQSRTLGTIAGERELDGRRARIAQQLDRVNEIVVSLLVRQPAHRQRPHRTGRPRAAVPCRQIARRDPVVKNHDRN